MQTNDDLTQSLYHRFKQSYITFLKSHINIVQNMNLIDYLRCSISNSLIKIANESEIKLKLLNVIGCINENTHMIANEDDDIFIVIEKSREVFEYNNPYLIPELKKFILSKVDEIIRKDAIIIEKDQLNKIIDYCTEQAQKDFPKIFDEMVCEIIKRQKEYDAYIDTIICIILDKSLTDINKLTLITQFIAVRKDKLENKQSKRKHDEIE